jgi:hypothetical protein
LALETTFSLVLYGLFLSVCTSKKKQSIPVFVNNLQNTGRQILHQQAPKSIYSYIDDLVIDHGLIDAKIGCACLTYFICYFHA